MNWGRIALLFFRIVVFVVFTVITQIGGIVFLSGLFVSKKLGFELFWQKWVAIAGLYLFTTYTIVPGLAGMLGRERVVKTKGIKPTNYMTVLLNRNYVRPELNTLLLNSKKLLKGTGIELRYLDAGFPFIDGFPLLPHLSHKDGKKLDLSLMYQNEKGDLTNAKRSISGYGVFEGPKPDETNQSDTCKSRGYFQYDYPKYLTMGQINRKLRYSNHGTKLLIEALLTNVSLGKMFVEPHLKQRLKIDDRRIAYHGCRAVRHDDHIHIQLK